jgi:lysophospholipase L1-like esterase
MALNWETLMCFGDSITIGARTYLGYPERCASTLRHRTDRYWNVVNHATSGFRVIDLARSIDMHSAELSSHGAGICTLMIGTNDAKTPTAGPDLSLAYSQLLLKLRLLMKSPNILLLEIPLLQSGVMLPYRLDMNKTIGEYNERIRALGEEHHLTVQRMTVRPDDLFDGVHLSDLGVERWGDQLAEMILSLRQGS